MKNATLKIPTVIWKRLPWIVLYGVALTGILFLCEFAYYRYSGGDKFINYSSFRINSVEEHQDVPFEACKETSYAYKITGNRTIYRIPEGKGEIDKVIVKTYPLDAIISTDPCVNAFISKEQYDFKAGNYQAYTTFNFTVKYGNQKSVTFKSNIFTILPNRPDTVEQISQRIKELELEIKQLKSQLRQAIQQSSTQQPTQTTQTEPRQPASRQPKPKPDPAEPQQPDNDGIILDIPGVPKIHLPSPF